MVASLYSHRNVTSTPGYPSGNIAVNITTVNRGKHGRNRNLKQPQHTTAQYFLYTIKSVQPPPVASTLKPLAKTLTTPPREDVLRLFPIGTTVVTESSSRTLSDQVQDSASCTEQHRTRTTIGSNRRDRRRTGWPGVRSDHTQGRAP